jgi:predicted metal-dependent phosphoesterase TrpH
LTVLPLKIDLHVHTCYSRDASTTLNEVVTSAKKQGLDGIAITDHNTLDGYFKLRKRGLIVIPGIEISSQKGHILGLNVTKPIPQTLSPYETIQKIHENGGIAIAAHPTTAYKDSLRIKKNTELKFDAIEVINSSTFPFFLSTHLSRKLAVHLNLPQTAGSDSHLPQTIGLAYTLIYAEPEVGKIIDAIKRGAITPKGKAVPWKMRFRKIFRSKKR